MDDKAKLKAYRKELKRQLLIHLREEKYVNDFIREMRTFGIDLGKMGVIQNISKDPSALVILLSFYGLGLTSRIIEAKKKLYKGLTNVRK